MNILITAGGTTEKIDNVRSITNSSTGRLGFKIAAEFTKINDANITLVAPSKSFKYNEDITFYKKTKNLFYKSTEDLKNIIISELSNIHYDVIIHSAAVSDYTTDFVLDLNKFKELINTGLSFDDALNDSKIDNNSKMSSVIESPAISLKQTDKIISLIKTISPRIFLVGFKLLDNVADETLFDVGFDLLRKNKCNLVVANDMSKIKNNNHEALIIYPEKSFEKVAGKDEISKVLVELICKRAFIKHVHSIKESEENNITEELYSTFQMTGKSLYDNNFLPEVINHERQDKIGTYGNMSVKLENGFMITGRNVHKGRLLKDNLVYVSKIAPSFDSDIYSEVFYNGTIKPSIDSAIHANIYKYVMNTNAIIHIHTNKVFLNFPFIDESFPCGSLEEKDAILEKALNYKAELVNNCKIIQMRKHGLIVLGNSLENCREAIDKLFKEYIAIDKDSTTTDYEIISHIEEVNATFTKESGNLYNLILNNTVIGCVWEDFKNSNLECGLFTKTNCPKGLNVAKNYLNLYNKNYIINTAPLCNIESFYKEKFGFKEIENINNHIRLQR